MAERRCLKALRSATISLVTNVPAPEESTTGDALWPVDAALGAAARLTRIAGGIGRAVVSSAPAQVVIDATRTITQPLTEEGQMLREGSPETGTPGLAAVVREVSPAVVDLVDIDAIVDQIDIDAIIAHVDIDAIIRRVDIDAILQRVDIAAIMDRVDVNAIVQRVDIDALMTQTELGSIIAESTSGVATQALDTVRSQGVGLDGFVARWANRLVRRDAAALPPGPPLLVGQPRALPPGDAS